MSTYRTKMKGVDLSEIMLEGRDSPAKEAVLKTDGKKHISGMLGSKGPQSIATVKEPY